jgi:hypothetical protein
MHFTNQFMHFAGVRLRGEPGVHPVERPPVVPIQVASLAERHPEGKEKAAAGRREMDWIFFWLQAHFDHARENFE